MIEDLNIQYSKKGEFLITNNTSVINNPTLSWKMTLQNKTQLGDFVILKEGTKEELSDALHCLNRQIIKSIEKL